MTTTLHDPTTTPTDVPSPAVAAIRGAGRTHWTGTEPDTDWLQTARELVPELAAGAERRDVTGEFPVALVGRLRDERVMSMLVPGALGGGGASHGEACAVLAELAHGCPSTSLALSMHTHLIAAQVWRHHRDLPAPVLAKVVQDQLVLVSTGAADWLESSGTAVRVEGGYRVSGRKAPASGAPAGDVLVTSVRWDDAPEGAQVLHAAVPFAAEGVSVEATWDATGMRATGSDTVVLDDVFVPDAAVSLVRPAGVWHPVWSVVIGAAMPLVMSTYVGVAEAAAERAVDLAVRGGHGSEVAPVVGRMLNSLTTARDAVRAMIDSSEDLHFDNDITHASVTLARKTVATDAIIDTVRIAFEVGGGQAYATSSGLGRLLRDSLGATYHPLPAERQARFSGLATLGLDPVSG